MRELQGSSARVTSSSQKSGRSALGAADFTRAYAADARLRSGYRLSARRRRLRSLLSGAAEGLALAFLLGVPIAAWIFGISLGAILR